jgi:sec-independent protein translocase protein TatA
MPNIGLPELLLLLLIIVLIFGARRLPELGRSLGEGIKNFRSSMKEGSRDDEASAPGKNDSTSTSSKP